MNSAKLEQVEGLDYFQRLMNSQTSYDVFRIVKDYCIKVGYDRFIVMRLPDGEDAGIADLAIITNWDPELIGGYDMLGLISDSPIFSALRKSTLPMVWRLDTVNDDKSNERKRDTSALFSEFNIKNGVYFHVTGPSGQRGTLGLAGDRGDPTNTELMEMSFLANHAFEALCNLDVMQTKTIDTLTTREKECIYWTACGKTSSEVGGILNISDNTVNNYLASAAVKLNTSNKAHTVAKAMRHGLLDNV